jgi:hypothetical protein
MTMPGAPTPGKNRSRLVRKTAAPAPAASGSGIGLQQLAAQGVGAIPGGAPLPTPRATQVQDKTKQEEAEIGQSLAASSWPPEQHCGRTAAATAKQPPPAHPSSDGGAQPQLNAPAPPPNTSGAASQPPAAAAIAQPPATVAVPTHAGGQQAALAPQAPAVAQPAAQGTRLAGPTTANYVQLQQVNAQLMAELRRVQTSLGQTQQAASGPLAQAQGQATAVPPALAAMVAHPAPITAIFGPVPLAANPAAPAPVKSIPGFQANVFACKSSVCSRTSSPFRPVHTLVPYTRLSCLVHPLVPSCKPACLVRSRIPFARSFAAAFLGWAGSSDAVDGPASLPACPWPILRRPAPVVGCTPPMST